MELTVSAAKEFVRARIDELAQQDSDMMLDTLDDRNLGLAVEKHLPEAIDSIHRTAPSELIQTAETGCTEDDVTEKVLSFHTTKPVLRIVGFRASDSPVVLTEFFPEDSPQGRIQLNRYVRGTFDEPVLVMRNGTRDHFRYYSLAEQPTSESSGSIGEFSYLSYAAQASTYSVSVSLVDHILNMVTGMVLASFGQFDRAKYFFEVANRY